MENHYIFVGSITNAMRGKQLLERQGIRAYLHRSTTNSSIDGCGYSLLVTENVVRVEQILKNSGVRVIRISDAL